MAITSRIAVLTALIGLASGASEWQVAVLPKDRPFAASDFALVPIEPAPSRGMMTQYHLKYTSGRKTDMAPVSSAAVRMTILKSGSCGGRGQQSLCEAT